MNTKYESKIISIILAMLLLIGSIPVNAFADEAAQKTVVSINTADLNASQEVPLGTAKEALNLPASLQVQVQTGTEAEQTEEWANVTWEGSFTPDKEGVYKLIASFADKQYFYSGEMPSVTVKVVKADSDKAAEEAAVLPKAETPNAEAPADQEMLKAGGEAPAGEGNPDDGVMLTDLAEIDLGNNISSQSFKVQLADGSYALYTDLPEGTKLHVGDEVWAQFKYNDFTNVDPAQVYYFNIPTGLSPLKTGDESIGELTDKNSGKPIGKFWVEDGKIKIQFDKVENGDTVTEGYLNFYASLNNDAVTQNGEIKLNGETIATLDIEKPTVITNAGVLKYNGEMYGNYAHDKLCFDASNRLVKYSIRVDTRGNTAVVNNIKVVDVLTTKVDGVSTKITGDYQNITYSVEPFDKNKPVNTNINPSFTKGADGNYVFTAQNVDPDTDIIITYYVPVDEGIADADFSNTATIEKNDQIVVPSSDTAAGNLKTTLQINKKAGTPQFDTKTGETKVTYTVEVTAPASNSVDIADAYVVDKFVKNGDLVTGITAVSSAAPGVSGGSLDGDKSFKVQLGNMKPGQKVTYTYTATLDTKECYFPDTPSEKVLSNEAEVKNDKQKFDSSNADIKFSRENTTKKGAYEPTNGLFKYTVTFNGMLPEATDVNDANSYYDGALKSFEDIITTNGFTFAKAPAPAPYLEAYRGDTVLATASITKDIDGNDIAGASKVSVPIPENMRGKYSYRLTYYVEAPDGYVYVEGATVENTFKSVTSGMVGTDNPVSTDLTFTTDSSISAAMSSNLTLTKVSDGGVKGVSGEDGYAVQGYKLEITSPISNGAEVKDWPEVSDGSLVELTFPIELLNDSLEIKMGTTVLTAQTDYKVETVTDPAGSFKITFLKEFPQVNDSNNKITITYKGKITATEAGKAVGAEANGLKNSSVTNSIKNHAELVMGNLTSGEKTAEIKPSGSIEKKAGSGYLITKLDKKGILWDISFARNSMFGEGEHTLVDELPDYLEVVSVQWIDLNSYSAALGGYYMVGEEIPQNTGSGLYWTAEGNNVIIHNANAQKSYRIVTRVKASAELTDKDGNKIDPDNFDDLTVENKAYYEAVGAKWYASASQETSLHRSEKTFKYSADTLTFTVDINKDAADLSDGDTLTIKDTMNKQLSLNTASLKITADGQEVPADQYQLKYTEGSNVFEVVVPDGKHVVITYQAFIDAEKYEAGWLENTAEIEGRGSKVTAENLELQRTEIGGGGAVVPIFYVKKTDEGDNLLPGASFTLTKVELQNGALVETGDAIASIDGGDGTYKLKGNGIDTNAVYVLKETAAPEGYVKDSKVHYIAFKTVSADIRTAIEKDSNAVLTDNAHTGGGSKVETMYKVVNKVQPTDIEVNVTKIWNDNNDQDGIRPESAIKVQLYKTVGNTTTAVGDPAALTEKDGVLSYTFTGLPPKEGDQDIIYSVKELKADGSAVIGDDNKFNDDYTVSYEGSMADGLVVKNTHTPKAEQVFTGKKTLKEGNNDKDITAGQFKFTVAAGDGNPAAIVNLPTGEISVGADGTFSLGTLSFPQAGTYSFTVSEVNGGAAGYTYDSNPVKVTVPVTLNAATNTLVIGTVTYEKAGQMATGIEFKNTYTVPSGASQEFTGKKTLKEGNNDKDITAGQFKFTVAAGDGNPAAIVNLPTGEISVGADGTFSLGTLSFPQAGTYTFTVSEVNGGAAGYTYDSDPVKVTVPVTLNAATNTLVIGTVTYEKAGQIATGIEFKNTYATPDGAEQPFTGKKTLKENGQEIAIAAGQFKFVAQEDESNPAAITGFPEGEMSVGRDGSFSLGTLGFTKAGEYKFTVSEVNGGAIGYNYDADPVTVTVPVTLDTDTNKLVIGTVKYMKGDAEANGISFENTYITPDGAAKVFNGKKTLKENDTDKGILAGQFKFTVAAGDTNPAAIGGLPAGELSVLADGTFTLGTLSFPQAGTYSFTVSEVNGGAAGYSYDDKPVKVTVPVTLNTADNTLVIGDVTYEKDGAEVNGIEFNNTYTTPNGAEQPFTGNKTLKENGEDKAIEAGQFKFVAQEDESNPAAITGFPEGEMSVGTDGSFSLGTLGFTKAGDYTFTVSEVDGQAAGYAYDDKAVTVNVKVVLDETDNKLVVDTVTYTKNGEEDTGISFENIYTTPEGAAQVFSGKKTLIENNDDKAITAGQFKFTVTEGRTNPAAIGGLPTGEISVLADGTFSLGTLSFTKAGTYTFTVAEVDSGAAGYTYDSEAVTVTVPVSLRTADNKLVIGDVTYEKAGQKADGIEFNNTYTTPDPIEYGFEGTKTLKENGEDKAIKEGQFAFVIQEGENNPAAVTLPEEAIPVKEDGSFEIGALTFTKDGTYTFIVSEENGGAAGYTYDDKAVTVTVNVVLDETDNTLNVESVTYSKDGTEEAGITFNNIYTTPDPASETVTGTKKLTENGAPKAITAGQFKFTVSVGADNPAQIAGLPDGEIKVAADGTFSLGTLSFEKAGDYSFAVSEVNSGEKGYTYDDKSVTVKAVVVLNEETNKLEVKSMTYEKGGKSADGIVFNNTFTPDPVKPVQPGGKSNGILGGLMPKTGDAGRAIHWILLLAMSGVGMIGLYLTGKRRKKVRR